MKRIGVLLLAVFLGCAAGARAQEYPELNRLLSRLQALSHSVHTQAEWDDTLRELDAMADRAIRDGRLDLVVQTRAIKAMAFADMKRDIPAALRVLEDTKRAYGQQKIPSVKRIYVQQAEYLGRIGDAEGVRGVIEEFRQNPNYDPVSYPVELHEGRNTPMTIVRPTARGADSVSVTAMEVARERARFAPGNLFPDVAWTDDSGRSMRLRDLRGKVVLVDFWHQSWTPWRRDLANLEKVYMNYRQHGFEVVGIALDRDGAAARAFAAQQRMAWPLVYGETELPRQLSLFGESGNFLLDANGVIVARNVRGAELTQALQNILGAR